MFKITISRKYAYIITRNRMEIARYTTKKDAKLILLAIKSQYDRLERIQNELHFYTVLFRSGCSLSVYTSKNNTEEHFKDYFNVKRIDI